MILDITEEELEKCYRNKQDKYKDMSKGIRFDLVGGEEIAEGKEGLVPSLSTISHIYYLRRGWDSYFNMDVIKENDQKDYQEMDEILKQANFEDIDISTNRGYDLEGEETREIIDAGTRKWNLDDLLGHTPPRSDIPCR